MLYYMVAGTFGHVTSLIKERGHKDRTNTNVLLRIKPYEKAIVTSHMH
jgi:hypothetical protein